jgi:ATP-binding cassette subfamily B protein RaxB
MVAGYFGKDVDLFSLRREAAICGKGSTFQALVGIATRLKLIARPVRLEISEISQLQLPAVLHWRMNHFVVLVSAHRRRFLIHDPAIGRRRIEYAEFDESFTGAALEVVCGREFAPRKSRSPLTLAHYVGSFSRFYRYLALMFCLLLVTQLLALVPSIATQIVIDEVILGQDRTWLYRALGGLAIVMLVATLLDALRGWASLYAGSRLSADSTVALIDHLFRLPTAFIRNRHLGDLMSKLESLAPIRVALTEQGVSAVVQLVVLVTTLTIMTMYSPWLTAVSVAGLAVMLSLLLVLLPRSRLLNERALIHHAAQNSSLVESLKAFETIQGLGLATIRRLHWQRRFLLGTRAQIAQGKLAIFRSVAGGIVNTAEQVTFLAIGVAGILDKEISLGVLFAFVVLRGRFGAAAAALTDLLLKFAQLKVHVGRLSDIARAHAVPDSVAGAVSARLSGALAVSNLRFAYDSHAPVIEGFHCNIAAGANVVITGPSGCGKTTLLKLFSGQLAPGSGQILVDGIERSLWNRHVLCDQCAIVLQNDNLFQGTITENICAFSSEPDLASVRTAAISAGIWADIQHLPMRTDTLIGDNGIGLSGGQVQRLALARALYRKPRMLFLDEATSHLDVDTEKRVLQNIAELGITVISVAHRPDAIALAGQVIALH